MAEKRSAPRISIALAVLSLEYLLQYMTLAVRYDGDVLQRLPGLWVLLAYSTALVAAAATGLSAFVIVHGARFTSSTFVRVRVSPLAVTVHLAGFAASFGLAVAVFAHSASLTLLAANASFAAWLACGTVSACALYVCALGKPRWESVSRLPRLLTAVFALAAAAWLSARVAKQFWHELAPLTLGLTRSLLQLAYTDVETSSAAQSVIAVRGFSVLVTDECSGIEGMGLITIFVAGYLIRYRDQLRFPAAFCMLPLGWVLAFVSNALRIATLVALGASVSPEIAKGGFHSNAGSILFCALAVGLVYSCQRWSFVAREPTTPAKHDDAANGDLTAAYLLPLVSLLAVGLVTSAFTSESLDPAYAIRLLVAGAALFVYRGQYKGIEWRLSPPAMLIGVGVFLFWLLLPPPDAEASSAAMQRDIEQLGAIAPLWLAARFVGSSLIVPVVEELAFRGYLQRRLISDRWSSVRLDRFTLPSFLVTALAFGALHPNWIAGTLAGAAFAVATLRSGRLADAVTAHATTNFLLCAWALAFGSWAHL